MGSTFTIHLFNATSETVKISLVDSKGANYEQVLLAVESWKRETDNIITVHIQPNTNYNQNAFSYSLNKEESQSEIVNWGLIIKRKLGKLVLVRSCHNDLKTELPQTCEQYYRNISTLNIDVFLNDNIKTST